MSDEAIVRSVRTITSKAETAYDLRVQDYNRRLSKVRQVVDGLLSRIALGDNGLNLREELTSLCERYSTLSAEYTTFLQRTRTRESQKELNSQTLILQSVISKVELALYEIQSRDSQQGVASNIEQHAHNIDPAIRDSNEMEDIKPQIRTLLPSKAQSTRSQHSYSSSTSGRLMSQRAKHEAAKVHLEFTKKKAMLLRKKADIEVDLRVLDSERELQQSQAELSAMLDSVDDISHSHDSDLDLSEVASERTEAYVTGLPNRSYLDNDVIQQPPTPQTPVRVKTAPRACVDNLRPEAPEFKPQHTRSTFTRNDVTQTPKSTSECLPTFTHPTPPGIADLTKYIMKKDLILSRLSQFNDRPERYFVWKTSFKHIISELEVTPTEELDLLCRWLGPESSKQADSLRAVNCSDEVRAVNQIWDRLDTRYGAPEFVIKSFQERLEHFTKLSAKDSVRLYELSDLLAEVESLKLDDRYALALAFYDSSAGVNTIASKLPTYIQSKWIDVALRHKRNYNVLYPPFTVFVEFIKNMAIRSNDPGFKFIGDVPSTNPTTAAPRKPYMKVTAKKTEVVHTGTASEMPCPIHGESAKHALPDCRNFQNMSLKDKKDIIHKYGICFKCCKGKHLAKDCKENIRCGECGSVSHCTAFHIPRTQGGEWKTQDTNCKANVKCTQVCGEGNHGVGKSCAKTVLVKIYPEGRREEALKAYAIIDDQSNRSLARSDLFDHFQENSEEKEYIVSSCAGNFTKAGRRATGYVMEALDGSCNLKCSTLIECNDIPDVKQEIPTPAVARHYRHLKDIERFIPEYEADAQILLLVGRDIISAHHVLDQRLGDGNEPYAQRLRLGWVIVGESCLGKVHKTDAVFVNKTCVIQDGRESILNPCPYDFKVDDRSMEPVTGQDVFLRTPHDEEVGMSREDGEFLEIMKGGFTKSPTGNWSAPLPFRKDRPRLPNNYPQAKQRAENLVRNLRKNLTKQEHFVEFMSKILENNHAEEAPPLTGDEEGWYLPIFGVYHPKKPSKIRVVFDSSAKFKGLSLNDILLTGPDLTNNLVGVLLKFRKEKVAITSDVEQMFFNFEVHEQHRNLLRFVWFKDNNPSKDLIEYRMRVHVFGNSPSPSVATYGLRKSACDHDDDSLCDDVCNYVNDNFYVDDGLTSLQGAEDAVDLVKRTQDRLKHGGNIRLHKIASNEASVLASFPPSDLAKNFTEVDFSTGTPNIQRSLGLSWNVTKDVFTYQVSDEEKPYTKRGLLSVVNSLFDPLGFVAPVVLGGRLLLREAIQENKIGWDDPLPEKVRHNWEEWKESLKGLETLEIPRTISDISVQENSRSELHIFADASKEAIGAVAYLKLYDASGNSQLGFVLGKSKVAPSHGHTIPRLELCAAVLATELSDFIHKHLAMSIASTFFYTDSQVVLGYINNETRRFYVYVSNRVDKVLKSSLRSQWSYVPTSQNPADHATRPVNAYKMKDCLWLTGPSAFLDSQNENKPGSFVIINPVEDKEVRPQIDVCKTFVSPRLGTSRFSHFSSWASLVAGVMRLKQTAAVIHGKSTESPDATHRTKVDVQQETERLLLREVQTDFYGKEIVCLQENRQLPRDSSILSLSPTLDNQGLLRIGGRLSQSTLSTGEKTPVIIPGKHHIALLLVRHYHGLARHQGRHITEGALRSAGYWVTGGKRLVNSVIHSCVECRKLRGKVEHQKMSDLPSDRLTPSPPFTYVGVDTFGPWAVVSRRTRGGTANSKRWAIMFSCLVSRAIHIEVVEELSSSSFINSLRRFVALRGPVKEFRSDRGTNFVGATGDLGIGAINVEDKNVEHVLLQHGTVWKFNPPHASHMSGAWERMIGVARRILDSMLTEVKGKQLTHEVLCTLMAEVCAIVNSRPITAVSNDPDSPSVLSPSALLTHKVNVDVQPLRNFSVKDMYKSQWRHVHVLADQFWRKWSTQYLQNLQHRRKWQQERRNLELGDVIMMKDSESPRNEWPVGVIEEVFPSSDGLIRKASVRVIRNGRLATYTRPISQLIYLCSEYKDMDTEA